MSDIANGHVTLVILLLCCLLVCSSAKAARLKLKAGRGTLGCFGEELRNKHAELAKGQHGAVPLCLKEALGARANKKGLEEQTFGAKSASSCSQGPKTSWPPGRCAWAKSRHVAG